MYLQNLTIRLAEGLAKQPEEFRARHVAYLKADQNADGGFSGREGESDLYYTGFALRALAVLNALDADLRAKAARYLRQSLTQQASVVDFFSLLYCCFLLQHGGGPDVLADAPADWPQRVAAELETFRTADGGYAKAAGGVSGSTYHTFLVGLCYQLLEKPLPRPEEIEKFVASRRREDGGYVELAPMKRSGTNPTAAALGVGALLAELSKPASTELSEAALAQAGQLLEELAATGRFLAEMVSPEEGGFRANSRAPVADLLSTFTGLWTLDQLGLLDSIDRAAALRYAQDLELPAGGFRAGLWDDSRDVEYTFYGLGVIGLLRIADCGLRIQE